jgi:hypothetical protein
MVVAELYDASGTYSTHQDPARQGGIGRNRIWWWIALVYCPSVGHWAVRAGSTQQRSKDKKERVLHRVPPSTSRVQRTNVTEGYRRLVPPLFH